MPRLSDVTAESLLQDFLSLVEPDGYRAELIGGEIVLSSPPDGNHQVIVGEIIQQVIRNSVEEMDFSGYKGLIVPDRGIPDAGRVIPDGTFLPARANLVRGAPPWMAAAGVAMVVEVTESQPWLDRETKRRSYAQAGIPLYLLIDRELDQVTLFSRPGVDTYGSLVSQSFGGSVWLPEPFAFTLRTGGFPGHRRS